MRESKLQICLKLSKINVNILCLDKWQPLFLQRQFRGIGIIQMLVEKWLMLLTNREIREVTLSLALLTPPNPSSSGICKVRKFY